MEIPGFKTHKGCPKTKGCMTRQVFEELATGDLYFVHSSDGMKAHRCKAQVSVRPDKVYIGEWKNNISKRIRWVGPHRLEDSVYNPPCDSNYKPQDWTLMNVYRGDVVWIRVPKTKQP